jgi:hypothetical protein
MSKHARTHTHIYTSAAVYAWVDTHIARKICVSPCLHMQHNSNTIEHSIVPTYIRVGQMTSPRIAECEARRASASLFPSVEDTRRPVRVSAFWAESAPSPQKSPKISQIWILCGWIGYRPIFLTILITNSNLLLYNTRKSLKGCTTGGDVNKN